MLVYVDESEYPRPRTPGGYTVWAGVGVPSGQSREFFRDLFNLEKRLWGKEEPYDMEIKGRFLLGSRGMRSPRKREFVEEILSLCKLNRIVAFAVGLRYPQARPGEGPFQPNTYEMIRSMVERVEAMMIENHPNDQAVIVFDSQEDKKDIERALEFGNYLYGTPQGNRTNHVCDTPIFASSSVTKGLQIADVFAYVLAQQNLGRSDLDRYSGRIREMEWWSREREEGQLWRGFRFRDIGGNEERIGGSPFEASA